MSIRARILIDIGVNLLSSQFDIDRSNVVQQAHAAGLLALLLTGTSVAESAQVADYIEQSRLPMPCFATAGIHPHYAQAAAAGWQSELRNLALRPVVKALGEMGLDYHRNLSPPRTQRQIFADQLSLAVELKLPLFVHDRDASADVASMLREHLPELSGVVVHCFTGTESALRTYLDLGCFIGITGWVCDARRGQLLRSLVPQIPLERLLVETDAPYLRPQNAPLQPSTRKSERRRNSPALLGYVIDALAELYARPAAELAAITTANAMQLFDLDLPGSIDAIA